MPPRASAQEGGKKASERAELLELERDLKAPRPETRRSAVKKLADLGTREAWALVLGALAETDGQVADEAQTVLARARDPRVVRDLCERSGLTSGDEWIALRAAEALGRVETAFDVRALVRCVVPNAPELGRTALWSIERLARAKRLGLPADGSATEAGETLVAKLGSLATGGCAGEVRGAALLALLPIDAFAGHDHVVAALTDRDEAVRCGAVVAAGTFSEQECLTISTRALDDPSERVRVAAIMNLEQQRSRQAMLALIDRLEREERTRLRWEILGFLRERSGEDHGFDLSAWRAWAQSLRGEWSTGDAKPPAGPLGDTRVALAGLTVVSDRVSFLVDMSGSMWDTVATGQTRKEVIDVMLRKCLESLPREAEFNLFPYTRDPFPWEKKLVRATPENVARACAWFERCHQRGAGDVYDAVLLALTDPEVDTLVILTDGKPTGGRHVDMDLMIELLVERNRFRQVAFDSILVESPRPLRRMWAELAERTGGRSVSVEDLAKEAAAQPQKPPQKPPK
jgi:HEAT repeat protein